MRTLTKSNTEWDSIPDHCTLTYFLQFFVECRCFASFGSEQEHFTHDMYITAPIRTSDEKKSNGLFYDGINAKVFRRSIPFAILVVVTSRSSSLEYIMSVHAGTEKNVCKIVESNETPQSTTNPSQTLLPVYKLAHLPLPHSKSLPPRPHNL